MKELTLDMQMSIFIGGIDNDPEFVAELNRIAGTQDRKSCVLLLNPDLSPTLPSNPKQPDALQVGMDWCWKQPKLREHIERVLVFKRLGVI